MKHLQKITFFLTIFFFITGTHSDENLKNIKKLDSFFEKGALSKKEYIAAKEYLDGKTENLKKKNFLLTKEKKSKNKKKFLDKIKKDFKIPEFTPKVAYLGTPKNLVSKIIKKYEKIFRVLKIVLVVKVKKLDNIFIKLLQKAQPMAQDTQVK